MEFALKLGYSERLVQLALERLTNPTQNELLAELIKLGAQTGSIRMHLELVFNFFLFFLISVFFCFVFVFLCFFLVVFSSFFCLLGCV